MENPPLSFKNNLSSLKCKISYLLKINQLINFMENSKSCNKSENLIFKTLELLINLFKSFIMNTNKFCIKYVAIVHKTFNFL